MKEKDLIWNFDFYPVILKNTDIVSKLPFSIITGHIPIPMLDSRCKDTYFSVADRVFCIDFEASRKNGKLGVLNISGNSKKVYIQDVL